MDTYGGRPEGGSTVFLEGSKEVEEVAGIQSESFCCRHISSVTLWSSKRSIDYRGATATSGLQQFCAPGQECVEVPQAEKAPASTVCPQHP